MLAGAERGVGAHSGGQAGLAWASAEQALLCHPRRSQRSWGGLPCFPGPAEVAYLLMNVCSESRSSV